METMTKVKNSDMKEAAAIAKIGKKAVDAVKSENREKGIPIVFSEDGTVFYELPDGTVTSRSPLK
jgi:hypothetical protein